jgi:TolA-binding protein
MTDTPPVDNPGSTLTEHGGDPVPDPPVHGVTLEQLEKHKADIRAEMEDRHNKTHAEMEELREELRKTNEELREAREAREQRERTTSSSNTVVVPPDNLAPRQPSPTHPDANQPSAEEEHHEGKRGWKRFW